MLPLPKPLTGQSGLERWLMQLRECVKQATPRDSESVKVTHTNQGAHLRLTLPPPASSPGTPGLLKQFRVKSVQNDHLVCREFDGTTEGASDVLVAKPFNLRRTGWHQASVVYTLEPYPGSPGTLTVVYQYLSPVYRTATFSAQGGGTVVEHQTIRPIYVPNRSVIFAGQSENGTGVSGVSMDWIDANFDARAWAEV